MTEGIVLDTNVFIVSLLDENMLNSEERTQRPAAIKYIDGLLRKDYFIHLPMIAMVEIVGVVRAKTGSFSLATVIKNQLEHWVSQGLVRLYDLEESRMKLATDIVIQHNLSRGRSLSAPDATFIALAEELDINVVTFEKYFEAVSSRALVLA